MVCYKYSVHVTLAETSLSFTRGHSRCRRQLRCRQQTVKEHNRDRLVLKEKHPPGQLLIGLVELCQTNKTKIVDRGQINEVWRVTVVLFFFSHRLGKRVVTGVTHSGSVWESVSVCSATSASTVMSVLRRQGIN